MSDENNRPALPGPAVKRLHELLYEMADLNEAMGRHLDSKFPDDCPTASRVLESEI